MTVNQPFVETHLAHLAFAGASPRTISARRAVLRNASKEIPLLDMTEADIMRFVSRPGLAPESRRAYLSHLRAYFAWLVDRGYATSSPAARIPSVKVPRKVPRPISQADIVHAVACAKPRMKAWILLGALAGLRCLEIAGLEPRDIHITETGAILVLRVTKGGHQATVPCHDDILRALAQLPVRDGKWWDVSARHVSQEISVYLRSVGVEGTAHRLRHASACAWYEASGRDLITVQRLLRHASVSSTQIYADVSPTRPAEVVALTRLAG